MLRKFSTLLAVASTALIVAACGGGSGSGGGDGGVVTPPPPPPTPPYASNCTTTPGALSCQTGAIAVNGPQTGVRADGVPASSFDGMQIDRKGTTATSDDVYSFRFIGGVAVIDKFYTNPQTGNDGLGPIRTAANVVRDFTGTSFVAGDSSTLTLYDITNVLEGGLDYVQLGKVAPNPINGAYTFFAVGRSPSTVVMPTTGSARFDGGTRGAYINAAGTSYSTASDVILTANFGTGAITGSTSNFRMINSSGATVAPPSSLDFNFSANIAGSTFNGTASGASMTGSVNGAFYGPSGGAPVEAGLAYRLTGTAGGGTLVGVGGLKKN